MKLKPHHGVKTRSLKRLAAFTMIEIALALAVIGFALVAIIGVLPAGMSVQKDNRESTLINFDANFLMDAITSGSAGLDDLTNHIINVSNRYTFYNIVTNAPPVTGGSHWIFYTTTGTTSDKPLTSTASMLTNGANIIALLTTPKYVVTNGGFYSNSVSADFRAITSSLADQGTSQAARDFAFTYRVFPEIIPYGSATMPWTNNPDPGIVANNFQANFTQIRLRFRWPVLANGQVGTSRLTFRTATSGALVLGPPLPPSTTFFDATAVIHPGNYVGVTQ